MSDDGQNPNKPPPRTGSEAFGVDVEGAPTGAEAFGGSDAKVPLKGALLFGNDPQGGPRGSEAFGGSDMQMPLKGALLFGNDPKGNPTGAEAFGGSDQQLPLKGALLFGNDPKGDPRGSEAFGGSDQGLVFRGSQSFGAPQLVLEKLTKDEIGYDFGGVLLKSDDAGIAGIRKDPRDRIRERVLRVLQERLGCEAVRLRHGVTEDSIPWGRLKREREFDRKLAEELRALYRRAPGEVLGIGQVRDLLEQSERMHSFELKCEWDNIPVRLTVLWHGRAVAFGESALHKEHSFFIFKSPKDDLLGYVDALKPRDTEQRARIRTPEGQLLATVTLEQPGPTPAQALQGNAVFHAVVRDAQERIAFRVAEERASPNYFLATFTHPESGKPVGRLEDRLTGGKIQSMLEMDLRVPRIIAWGIAAVLADLSRLRRAGWPEGKRLAKAEKAPEAVESIEQALGPRKPRRTGAKGGSGGDTRWPSDRSPGLPSRNGFARFGFG